jgi:hypothetical protein
VGVRGIMIRGMDTSKKENGEWLNTAIEAGKEASEDRRRH